MDFKKTKNDFPIFRQSKHLVYLDNSATTQKPQVVIDAVSKFYSEQNSNVHRGLYDHGEIATTLYESARQKIASFINAKHVEEIVFTSGTTESINFVANGWGLSHLRPGDEILITQAEHHANMLPWQYIAGKTGAVLKFIEINPATYLFNDPERFLTSRTKLIAVTHHSNVLGPVWGNNCENLKKLISSAQKQGVKVLIDAAQIFAHQKFDVQALNADFVAFSGHKMFGPTGVGVLFIKKDLHEEVNPFMFGGGMVNSVSWESAKWAPAPHKFEAGTPPISSAIGLAAAVDYIQSNFDFNELKTHQAELCKTLVEQLNCISQVRIVGNIQLIESEGHLVSFAVEGIHAHDIAGFVGSKGIAVRAGHHCAQPLVKHLGFESLVRVSFAAYNTIYDVEVFVKELKSAITIFKK
ncbi:MAG: Cysteine desulfurase [candidate division TM6 bacterium GW2011_GWF2_37_49]|nr:MAG: Cysteine desulfurase [candidate division TM6 bacterium GW2011_GWF2_37_49]